MYSVCISIELSQRLFCMSKIPKNKFGKIIFIFNKTYFNFFCNHIMSLFMRRSF